MQYRSLLQKAYVLAALENAVEDKQKYGEVGTEEIKDFLLALEEVNVYLVNGSPRLM